MVDLDVPFISFMFDDIAGMSRVYMRNLIIHGLVNIFFLVVLISAKVSDLEINSSGDDALFVYDRHNMLQVKWENGYITIWIIISYFLYIVEMLLSFYLMRKVNLFNYL